MTKLPVLRPGEVAAILERLGFALVRRRGSHRQYRHADGRGATVPFHLGRDISPILLRQTKLLAQSFGMSPSELFEAALAAYIVAHAGEEVTDALNRVYETENSAIEPSMIRVQLVSVGGEAW
jgi:predicted RNA binding protein YcfA (HicA-like mRNA interferase family)